MDKEKSEWAWNSQANNSNGKEHNIMKDRTIGEKVINKKPKGGRQTRKVRSKDDSEHKYYICSSVLKSIYLSKMPSLD